ncbi:HAMP domain-containing histidine kinase [Flavobacteriales bacterium]|jgi:nitrogen-specific signal transduction histidine kinase|nr:HAMP domain-containing histidine kinase [Flavobacteriales bacterium]
MTIGKSTRMNIYSKKQVWKIALLLFAVIIGILSLWYTNDLVKELKQEEERKVKIWAEATSLLTKSEGDISFIFSVIQNNKTIPVILVDENEHIISFNNLDSAKINSKKRDDYLADLLEDMKHEQRFISFPLSNGKENTIYYQDSVLLTRLNYYPYIQLGVLALFIFISYLAFSSSRKAEQNQVWVGMAKETAHQLGTPLSSLIAWLEYLKLKGTDEKMVDEIRKDLNRLEIITERFSKIGAVPDLKTTNVKAVFENFTVYLEGRISKNVRINVLGDDAEAAINVPLFEWVIENICKNAVDAMGGKGSLVIDINDNHPYVYVDITDTGKGIPSNKFKTVFQPGYTSKKRGWGLGLSLAKRIIENYHNGKIFVKSSELDKGTTFRIVLSK